MSDLTRRGFLAGAAAAGLAPLSSGSQRTVIKPPRLRPGDTVAIVCPSGPADDEAHLQRGVAKVESLGFRAVVGPNAAAKNGYLAGTDEQRVKDLVWAARNEEVRGVIVLRGGYGVTRLLPDLAGFVYPSAEKKIWMGYSDFTGLALAMRAQGYGVTFHGPCAESTWDDFARSTLPIVMNPEPFGEVLHPADAPPRLTLVRGSATGELVGGNLTLVSHLVGTAYLPSLRGRLLFLEDIGEDPYRVDRMLTQIFLAWERPAGLIFGNFRKRGETEIADEEGFSMEQVLLERAREFGVPAVMGFSFGHIASNHILPIGVQAELNATNKTLTIESAVV